MSEQPNDWDVIRKALADHYWQRVGDENRPAEAALSRLRTQHEEMVELLKEWLNLTGAQYLHDKTLALLSLSSSEPPT